jgi:ribosomal protein S18 acetylase RimI-like enzyme
MLTADLTRVRQILAADPVWATYALADLQPHLAADCTWLASTTGEALVLIYRGLQPPVLVTAGDPAVLADLLPEAADRLPAAIYASIREEHLSVVTAYYDLQSDLRPMRRMYLVDPAAILAAAGQGDHQVVPLAGAAAGDVLKLLEQGGPFTPDAFSPAQMDAGVFCGVYAAGDLLAVGGTHVVDYDQGIAAIGNMYTHPAHRRRGCSAAILRAIVCELCSRGVTQIVLNVDQRNPGAQALYEAHGFVVHVPYFEGKANRHVVRVQ